MSTISKLYWIKLGLLATVVLLLSFTTTAQTQSSPAQSVLEAQQSATTKVALQAATSTAPSPEKVRVGIYLNDIQAIDLKLHNYLVDFYIWYRWSNPDLDPSSSMEFVNHSESWSTMLTPSYEKPEKLADGTFYQAVHVQGKMSRKMDLHDYPFDEQLLRVVIEDTTSDASEMQYEVDKVSVNADLKLPGYLYKAPLLNAENYQHQTTFGDPRSKSASIYSRLTFDLPIQRPHVNAFLKNILPILLAVICCSLAFLLHPTLVDSRFQIAVMSLLSIVALQITSSSDLPTVEYMTLLDKLYVIGYFYSICVVAALAVSTKIGHIHDGEINTTAIRSAVVFDRACGVVLFSIYMLATLWTIRLLF